MLPEHKKTLKSLVLTLRHLFEGQYDESGAWHPGDLERRLNALGVFADRAVPLHDMGQLADADRRAREVVDAYIALRDSAGIPRESAVREYVRESAHTWANRLLALRMMEARGLIDEVVLARADYGNRSLEHHRALQANASLRAQEDEGLVSVLEGVFKRMSVHLPNLFEPKSPATALRPSITALRKAIALLSSADAPRGQQPAAGEVFIAPDALGWAYQYWNTEEKDRVFEEVRTKKSKISGDDIIPATQLYTEPYMVKFLVQNSLGATWMCMHPDSKLAEDWEYYIADADRGPMDIKAASELTFLDPACGSGHFLLEAFDMLFDFYEEEGERDASAIATSILERNLFGIDIDERAVQIAEGALWMRAAERVPGFTGLPANLLAANIRLPDEKAGADSYLAKYPEDAPLRPALESVLSALQNADELGSLLKLEEPIEDELKALERAFERSSARGTQVALFGETPVQGQLPTGVSSYNEWKHKVVGRLAGHFHDEAVSADAGAAWFGRSAGKGIKLFELLSMRYDVVAANPPYMGLGTMGPSTRRYVETHYHAARYDLYAAFILRCADLTARNGRVAMVTQQTWMFQSTFERLRTSPDASGLLEQTCIECVAHLGTQAFGEIAGAVVSTAAFVIKISAPSPTSAATFLRLDDLTGPAEKARMARACAAGSGVGRVYVSAQQLFASIPAAPLAYWLPAELLHLLATVEPMGKLGVGLFEVKNGLDTGDNSRFLRFRWETLSLSQWANVSKGGGYAKWRGYEMFSLNWGEFPRIQYACLNGTRIQNTAFFFKPVLCYSLISSGALGVRLLDCSAFEGAGLAIVPDETRLSRLGLAALLNTRLHTYLLRVLAQSVRFRGGYLERLPAPGHAVNLDEPAALCLALKDLSLSADLLEGRFDPSNRDMDRRGLDAVRHSVEGAIDALVFDGYGISPSCREVVLAETGRSPADYPLVSGAEAAPPIPTSLGFSSEQLEDWWSECARIDIAPPELDALRRKLRLSYERGPGPGRPRQGTTDGCDGDPDDSLVHIPVPSETFLEQLCHEMEIHPISVYWLLREGIKSGGWRCIPEEQKELANAVTVLVLRALGHRWPTEAEADEPVASYADPDGVIPISGGTDERTLIERLRDVIEEETGTAAATFEAQFADAMGMSLDTWLATKFFSHHVTQFKKRPIAWHLVSSRPTARRQPAFSALVYYHALDADLIPKIRSHYLRPLRTRAETELRGIEATPEATRSAAQASRRAELDERVAELKDLDERLESIEREGFDSAELNKLIANESIDSFCSIDGIKPKPGDTEAFVAQERAYRPDLNDGVRVNIAPWQKAGALAADVLAKKDLDKAIADRARWRSDERRWCREGKLPRPGWWPEA